MFQHGFPLTVPSRPLLVAAVVVALFAAGAATAATAPTTPTFAHLWGSSGSAPGQMDGPRGLSVDADGDVYVAELFNYRVEKFDRLGNLLLRFGSNGTGNGQFQAISDVAVDPWGNLFTSDQTSNRIQKFSSTGAYVLQWGSTGSGNGQFNQAGEITTDAAGNVYVVDYENHRVQKFAGTGAFLLAWGGYGPANGQFNQPLDIAIAPGGWVYVVDVGPAGTGRMQKFTSNGTYVSQWALGGAFECVATDRLGNVYVAEYLTGVMRKYSADGVLLTSWGSAGTGPGQFSGASALGADAEGNLYVAEYLGDRVQKFSGAGAPVGEARPAYLLQFGSPGSGTGEMASPWSACVGASAEVYVVDTDNNRIQRYTMNGALLSTWGTGGSGNGQFSHPTGVCADAAGNVYVADQYNNRVQKFTSTGAYLGQWGAFGSGNGQFNGPVGVAADASGYLYVTDFNNNRVQKFTTGGAYVAQWGTGGTGNGQLSGPFGIAADASGFVYVVEQINSRVQKFTSTGTYVTKWGSPGGLPGLFVAPTGVAVDGAGNLYVADYLNDRVQRFTTNGTFLAALGAAGPANGHMIQPIGVAVDATGNLFVVDTGNSRVQRFVVPPVVALVADVGNDQGRQARVRILRSSADAPGMGFTINGYEVYRRNDPLPGGLLANDPPVRGASPAGAQLAGWTYVGTAPAHGESEYELVVPTLVDATASSPEYTAFFVRAVTNDPFLFFDSAVDAGYSLDNLPPATPSPFVAAYLAGATHLHWGPSEATDFATFRLYRGTSASFVPGPGNLVTATADTNAVDAGAAGGWYKLTAVDRNGNESVWALVGPGQTTAVETAPGLEFALHAVRATPAEAGRVRVDFTLPGAGPARLDLLDVSGRRVGGQEVGALGAGRHRVTLGPDRALDSGIYFVRLQRGGEVRTLRAIVLR